MSTKLTRQLLYDLVWSTPMTHLAKKFSISDNGLRKICKKMEIPLPKAGHWEKLRAGKIVIIEKLPNYTGEDEIDLASREKSIITAFGPISDAGILKSEIDNLLNEFLEVPDRLTNPTEFTQEAKRNMETAKGERNLNNGLLYFHRGLSFHVEPNNVARALRFMDALIKLVVARGHLVRYDDNRSQLVFKINTEEFQIAFREKSKRIEVESKNSWDRFKLIPSGIFLLSATGWLRGELIWHDGRLPLEKQLSKILAIMEIKSATIAKERKKLEEQWALRDEEIRKEKEQEELIANEILKVKKLIKDAKRWRIAKDIREYVSAGMTSNDKHSMEDIEWARKKADWIDPTYKVKDGILGSFNHDVIK
jgi:hypothetical protein